MLTLFRWLDENHASYWLIAAVPTTLLLICLVRTLRAADGTGPLAPRRVDWCYAALMFLFLLGWRWPPLFEPFDLNPDESWLIAGALTLRHDPVFWRSVDGITSGPLNFYALLPLHLVGLPLNYCGARLTGLLMVWGASTGVYAALRSAYGTRIARVAILPGLVFFAAPVDRDFIHYSSENFSLLLEGVGLWLLWKHRPRFEDAPGTVRWQWLAGGVVVGLMPWAKLQSSPPALALAMWGAWLAFSSSARELAPRSGPLNGPSHTVGSARELAPRSGPLNGPLHTVGSARELAPRSGPLNGPLQSVGSARELATGRHPLGARTAQIAKLAAATLAPSVIFLIGIAAFGVFEEFYRSYLLDNFTYVEKGDSYAKTAALFLVISQYTWHYLLLLIGVVVVGLAAQIALRMQKRAPGPITVASLLFTLVAFWVVLAPGRSFQHYLLYTVLPLAAWAGASYGDMAVGLTHRGARAALAGLFVAVAVAPMLVMRVAFVGRPPVYGHFAEHWQDPYDKVGKVLVKYRRDGDTMGLWGWYSHAYVQAQLPQAQREAESEHQLRRWPLRDSYFRPKYMEEIRRNRPAIFVDAVGPNAFRFNDRKIWAHETFRELRTFIQENYTLAADEGHARVYVRNDRQAEIEAAVPR